VPEGIYQLLYLNPHSRFHVSMKVSYPNEFDRRHAAADGRTRLGGDIFIHGDAVSIGCIAVGDTAIEELYTLVEDTGVRNVRVIIAPNDMRNGRAEIAPDGPRWIGELYRDIANALAAYPARLEHQ